MGFELEKHAGQRVEIELKGRVVRGRVVRGPARRVVLLEERGTVGAARSDMHQELRVLRTWTAKELEGATLRRIIDKTSTRSPRQSLRSLSVGEIEALAESDPAIPPPHWEGGLLAWAQRVQAARRRLRRIRAEAGAEKVAI